MSFRGSGGFGAPILRRPRSRAAAGDFSDASDFGFDESSGLDLGSDAGVPDFSDVVGGSSSTADFSTMASAGGFDLGNIGTAIQKFLPGPSSTWGLGGLAGSAAAAGKAVASSPSVRRAIKGFLGRGGHRRRMNPGNFKALRRSMHRLQMFERAARKVVHFTHPKPTARVKFRFHRRRKR